MELEEVRSKLTQSVINNGGGKVHMTIMDIISL